MNIILKNNKFQLLNKKKNSSTLYKESQLINARAMIELKKFTQAMILGKC